MESRQHRHKAMGTNEVVGLIVSFAVSAVLIGLAVKNFL